MQTRPKKADSGSTSTQRMLSMFAGTPVAHAVNAQPVDGTLRDRANTLPNEGAIAIPPRKPSHETLLSKSYDNRQDVIASPVRERQRFGSTDDTHSPKRTWKLCFIKINSAIEQEHITNCYVMDGKKLYYVTEKAYQELLISPEQQGLFLKKLSDLKLREGTSSPVTELSLHQSDVDELITSYTNHSPVPRPENEADVADVARDVHKSNFEDVLDGIRFAANSTVKKEAIEDEQQLLFEMEPPGSKSASIST